MTNALDKTTAAAGWVTQDLHDDAAIVEACAEFADATMRQASVVMRFLPQTDHDLARYWADCTRGQLLDLVRFVIDHRITSAEAAFRRASAIGLHDRDPQGFEALPVLERIEWDFLLIAVTAMHAQLMQLRALRPVPVSQPSPPPATAIEDTILAGVGSMLDPIDSAWPAAAALPASPRRSKPPAA